MFVSLKEAPFEAMNKWWYDVVPYIMAFFAVSTYVLIPIFIIFQSLFSVSVYNGSKFTGALWLYPINSLVILALWVPM